MKIKHETRLHCYNERSSVESNFKRQTLGDVTTVTSLL